MYRFYLCLLIIIINGFIPTGKFNAIYTLISWILFTIQISWDIKNPIPRLSKLIPLILLLSFIGTVIYIYPYLEIYNFEGMEDLMINTLNAFIYLIIGLQFSFYLKELTEKNKFNNELEVYSSLKNILKLQKLNLFMCIFLIILGPYITKLIFFRPKNIYNFVNSGTLLNDLYIKYVEGIPGGFPAKNIDFTSINFLSLSFNHSTRNSFLLIPLVFIFISYLLLKITNKNEKKIFKNSEKLVADNFLRKIRISYLCTYIFSVIYLLCSGSRVGIFIGYALLALLLFTWRIICTDNEYLIGFSNNSLNKKYIPKIIGCFLILIIAVPYQYLFPYSCKTEIAYSSILSKSTIPIVYEIKNIINNIRKVEAPKAQIICKKPVISKLVPNRPFIFSRYYQSSTFRERLNIYSKNQYCKDKENCKPLIRHESLIRDVLYPFRLVKLTLPISSFILLIWFVFIFKFFNNSFNREYALNTPNFKIDGLDNLIPIVGTAYFIFNSANSPAVCLCFGILYIRPIINFINSKKFLKKTKFKINKYI